jgi:nucleotide-binding universal stress UspA family protein
MVMQESGGAQVLVGADGSPAAMAAVRWAAAEARLRSMRLHVVHVEDPYAVEPAACYAPPGPGQRSANRTARRSGLTALIRAAVGPDGWAAVQIEFAEGLPVRVLLDRAADAAMLILGSTRPSGMPGTPVGKPRAPLGPVVRDCLRAAPCPVVIVAHRSVQPQAEPVPAG